MSVAFRVAKLSHAELVELVVASCEESPAIKNRADALVAQVAPLPAWCVEVLLSPDLLSACFSSLALTDGAAVAATCSAWRTAWKGRLVIFRPVLPTVQLEIPVRYPTGLCVREMHAGDAIFLTLAISSHDGCRIQTVSCDRKDGRTCGGKDLEYFKHAGVDVAFHLPGRLLHFEGALFVSDLTMVRKFAPDGTELASYCHPDADEDECRPDTALHQPSGVLFVAVTLREEGEEDLVHVVLELDAATLEPRLNDDGTPSEFASDELSHVLAKRVAVYGDCVIVTEQGTESEAFTANFLHVLNLDGTLIRTIEPRGFGPPQAMVVDKGRIYLVEDRQAAIARGLRDDCEEYEDVGRRLFVIDLETGRILQQVPIEGGANFTDVVVHDGCVYICDFDHDCVFMLNILAQSDAPEASALPRES